MNGLAVRISMPYASLHDVVDGWRHLCSQLIVYEHPSEVANRVHCHMLIIDPHQCVRSFKNASGLKNGGNSLWSFKGCKQEGFPKYITYMSKGIYDPSFSGGTLEQYTWKQLENFKNNWIDVPQGTPRVTPGTQKWLDFRQYLLTNPLWIAYVEVPREEAQVKIFVENIAKRYCIARWGGNWNQQCQNEIVSHTRSFMWELKEKA